MEAKIVLRNLIHHPSHNSDRAEALFESHVDQKLHVATDEELGSYA